MASLYVAGLFSSMLIYRAFFHRLRHYPGPFLAKLSTFYITARSVKKLHLFEEVQKLHAQYGDYVRLGNYTRWMSAFRDSAYLLGFYFPAPCELSISDPEAVKFIYGSNSPVTKGPWYTLLEPRTPLFIARDKREHARRRKVWDQGFSTKGETKTSIFITRGCNGMVEASLAFVALNGYDPRITKAIDKLLHIIDKDRGQAK
jgi:cytochrome P450